MNNIEIRQFSYRVETDKGVLEYHDTTSVSIDSGRLFVVTSGCINCFTEYVNAYEISPPIWVTGERNEEI